MLAINSSADTEPNTSNPSKRSPLSGAAFLIGQTLLLNIISIPVSAVIIRSLGPTAYGQWAAAAALVAAISCLANPGLGVLFARAVAQKPEETAHAMAEQLGLRASLSVIVGLFVVALAWVLRYPAEVVLCVFLCAFGLVFSVISSTFIDVLQALGRVKSYSLIAFVTGMVINGTTTLAALTHTGASGLSAAYMSGPVVQCALLWITVHRGLFPVRFVWNLKRFRALLMQSKIITGKQLLLSAQSRIEQLLLPKISGMAMGGYFFAGQIPASRLVVFPESLCTAAYSRIAGAQAHQHEETTQQIRRLLLTCLAVTLPLAVGVFCLSDLIAHVLFPQAPELCKLVIQITIWSLPIQSLEMPMGYGMEASGKAEAVARATIGAAVTGGLLSFLLMWRFGLAGASVGYLLRNVAQIIFVLPAFMRMYPHAMGLPTLARVGLCCILMALPLGVIIWFEGSSLLLLAGMVLAFALYVMALLVFRIVKISDLRGVLRRATVS